MLRVVPAIPGARLRGAPVAALLACALAVAIALLGVPLDRPAVMLWCCAFALALTWHRTDRPKWALVADWLPLALLLTAYDFSRGAAKDLGIHVHYLLPAQIDYWLTGTIPSVWLQQHLYGSGFIRWWNVPLSLLYASHFVLPYVVMAALWIRARPAFHAFTRRFIVLTAMALGFYALDPTAPPWLDSSQLVIGPVTRTAALGWDQLHLRIASQLFQTGDATFNVDAAFPSLHAAYPALFVAFFWSASKWPIRAVLVAYALAMGFMLVLTGEHWVIDVIGGWAAAGLACWVTTRCEQLRTR